MITVLTVEDIDARFTDQNTQLSARDAQLVEAIKELSSKVEALESNLDRYAPTELVHGDK